MTAITCWNVLRRRWRSQSPYFLNAHGGSTIGKQLLDGRDSAIDSIECQLKSAHLAFCRADQERARRLNEHLVYIANNKDRMRYVTLAIKSLPIGSGVTEASAKTVIGKRANGSGQRWRTPGLRGVLTLRAIHQSDRLPRFWNRFSSGYTATVQKKPPDPAVVHTHFKLTCCSGTGDDMRL